MYFLIKGAPPYTTYESDQWRLRPTRFYLSKEINKPGRCIMILEDEMIDDLLDETDHTNPAQLRASIAIWGIDEADDTAATADRIYEGRIFSREISKGDGHTTIKLELLDLLGTLAESFPQVGPPYQPRLNLVPEYFQATDMTMTSLKSTDATYKYWFYPDPSTAQAWCPVSGAYATVYTNSTTDAIAQAATTITTNTTNHRRMKQRGIIKIIDAVQGNEYVYYDGYGLNAAGTGYEFRNLVRGCLGSSTPANHDASSLELRQFVPARMYIDNGDWSLAYKSEAPNVRIIPHPEDGYFEFSGTGTLPTSVTATYKYINENDAAGHAGGTAFWTLELALRAIIEAAAPLGPNLTVAAGNLTVEVPDVVLPHTSEWGADCLTMALKLLDERGLTGHIYDASYPNSHPRLGMWAEFGIAASQKVVVSTVVQSNANAVVWPGFTSVRYKYSMDNTYTSVSTVYTDSSTGSRSSRTVYLTDTHAAGNYDSVLNANAYDKFRGLSDDYTRAKVIERGEMSAGEATAMSESILRQGLVLADSRVYEVDQFPPRTTWNAVAVGDTIRMSDGFYGILTRYDLRCEGGTIHGTLYLTDTLGGVV